MVTQLTPAKAINTEQLAARRDLATMFSRMNDQLQALIGRSVNSLGVIPPRDEQIVVSQARDIVTSYFVGQDGRHAFRSEVVPLAIYPRILNQHLAGVTAQVVLVHHQWWNKNIPEDIRTRLNRLSRKLTRQGIGEQITTEKVKQRARVLFADSSNPGRWKSGYSAPHVWVDVNGYRLSDRVWQVAEDTRKSIDRFMTYSIRNGLSSREMSKELEQFVLVGKSSKTNRPYGSDASFPAMRLARTEISHAGNNASLVAARVNPYVDGVEWVISASHPRADICDQFATMTADGSRLRAPYPTSSAQIPPGHAHCLCYTKPHMVDEVDISTINDEIRKQLDLFEEHQLSGKTIVAIPSVFDEFMNELVRDLLRDGLIQFASDRGFSVPARLLISQLA